MQNICKNMDQIVLATIMRRRQNAVTLFLILELLRRNQRHRRLWSRQWLQRRDTCNSALTMLFEELGPEDPKCFQNYTRMQEEVMKELLLLVCPYIEKKNTVMRQAISPQMRLSATLRFLATGNSFQDLAYSTRIAPNTLSQIVPETLQAIIAVLEEKVMSFPCKPEDWEIIANKFQTMWQFPHCLGALDENFEAHESRLRGVCQQGGNRSCIAATEIRDMFSTYFNTIGAVPWQDIAVSGGNC